MALPNDIPYVIAAAGIDEDNKVSAASSRGPVSWAGIRFIVPQTQNLPLIKPDVTGCFGGYSLWTYADAWGKAKRNRVSQVVYY